MCACVFVSVSVCVSVCACMSCYQWQSRMWTKQNVFHEIGHKIKYWCRCKCQQHMPFEQCQFSLEKGINKTFPSMGLILKYIKKRKIHKEFFCRGDQFSIILF